MVYEGIYLYIHVYTQIYTSGDNLNIYKDMMYIEVYTTIYKDKLCIS